MAKAEVVPPPTEMANPEVEKEHNMEETTRDADGLEEDMARNQSLDLDFARKVMDTKLADVEAGAMNSQVPTKQFRIMPGTATAIASTSLTITYSKIVNINGTQPLCGVFVCGSSCVVFKYFLDHCLLDTLFQILPVRNTYWKSVISGFAQHWFP
jgi:hypothetical protein